MWLSVRMSADLPATALELRSTLTDDGVVTMGIRETEVVARLVAGDRNKDIARRLGITPKTVMHHTSSIYRKLGVRGRSDTVAWALRGPNNF